MKNALALFDMDGTLCDYMGQLKKDMEALLAPGEEEYTDLYDESKPWLKARMDLIKNQPGWWLKLPELEAGMQIYRLAVSLGFDTEILTKGPNKNRRAWAEKAEWVDAHIGDGIPPNVVGKSKANFYGSVLVEDYTDYLLAWLEFRPRGLGILIDNPQNQGFTHENVIRYNGTNLTEIAHHLWAAKCRQPGQHWKELLC